MARWLFLLMSLMAPVVSAQTTDFERILLPIAIDGEVPGAFGSRWAARLAIMNTSADGIRIFGYNPYPGGCVILCPPVPTTPPGITFFPSIAPGSMSQGAIIEVERRSATSVRFNLRFRTCHARARPGAPRFPSFVRLSSLRARSIFSQCRFPALFVRRSASTTSMPSVGPSFDCGSTG